MSGNPTEWWNKWFCASQLKFSQNLIAEHRLDFCLGHLFWSMFWYQQSKIVLYLHRGRINSTTITLHMRVYFTHESMLVIIWPVGFQSITANLFCRLSFCFIFLYLLCSIYHNHWKHTVCIFPIQSPLMHHI